MDFEPRLALTTTDSTEKAEKLAAALVERSLAVCVNIVPGLRSVYQWEGKVHHDSEWLLIIKTSREKWPELEEAIGQLHSYDCPELVLIQPDEVTEAYGNWWRESLSVD